MTDQDRNKKITDILDREQTPRKLMAAIEEVDGHAQGEPTNEELVNQILRDQAAKLRKIADEYDPPAQDAAARDPIAWIKATYLMWLKGDLEPEHMRLGHNFFDARRAAALRAPAEDGWHPIETAPMDGTSVLIAEVERSAHGEAYYDSEESRWYWANTGRGDYPDPHQPFPSHWMPLPSPPVTSTVRTPEVKP